MKGRVLLALVVAAAGVFVAAPAEAATGSVSGTVSAGGSPVASGYVQLLDDHMVSHAFTTVGSNGTYAFTGVQPGSYRILSSSTNSQTIVGYLGFVTVQSGVAADRNLALLPVFRCTTSLTGTPHAGWPLHYSDSVTPAESYLSTTGAIQWQRRSRKPDGSWGNTEDLPETNATRVLTDADVGHQISAGEDVWNPSNGRIGECFTDDVTSVVVGLRLPALTGGPLVTGRHKVRKTLTVTVSLAPGTTASYQWFRVVKKTHHKTVTKPIAGATSSSYRLKRKDGGMKVFVQVRAAGGPYAGTTASSAPAKVHR